MTPEERAAVIWNRYISGEYGGGSSTILQRVIAEAVAEERERCARIVWYGNCDHPAMIHAIRNGTPEDRPIDSPS